MSESTPEFSNQLYFNSISYEAIQAVIRQCEEYQNCDKPVDYEPEIPMRLDGDKGPIYLWPNGHVTRTPDGRLDDAQSPSLE